MRAAGLALVAVASLAACGQDARPSDDEPGSTAGAAVEGCLDAAVRDHGLDVDAEGALGAVDVGIEDSGWWAVVATVDDEVGEVVLRCTVVPEGASVRVASSSVTPADG